MFRFIFRLIFLCFILLLLALFFLPNLVSTEWGKKAFFKAYKSMTGNTLSADRFEISWWKGQTFENLTFIYPQKNASFFGPEVTTDATLWQLLFFHDLGTMKLSSPQITLNADLPVEIKKKMALAGFFPQIAHVPMKSLPPYWGHVNVQEGTVKFVSRDFDPIELQNVALDASFKKSQINLKGNGKTVQGSVKGDFDLSLSHLDSQIDLATNLQNFPMRSIDQTVALFHPRLKETLIGSIGEAINVQLKMRNLPQTFELFCEATSPSFSAQIETSTQDGIVTLAKPALLQFTIPPSQFQKLSGASIQNPFHGQLKIDNLSLPLSDRENFSFQATFKAEALQFPFGTVQPFALFLSSENFKNRQFIFKIDSPQIQINSDLYLPNEWAQMTWSGQGLLPGNTRVNFSAQTLSAINATVHGDEWQGQFSGGVDLDHQSVFLNKPAEITYHITQLPSPLPAVLDQPLKAHIQIKPLRLSLPHLSGSIDLEIQVDPTTIKGHPFGPLVVLASGDLSTKKGNFDLSSTINQGKIHIEGSFQPDLKIDGKATLSQFPTSFIDLFLNSTPIASIIGPTLDASIEVNSQKNQISWDLKSEALTSEASFVKTDTTLTLTKPAKIGWTLTPEGYAALDRLFNKTPTPFQLHQPITLKSSIKTFSVPYSKEKFDLAGFTCQADLSIDTLSFIAKNSDKNTQLNQIQLHLDHLTPSSPIAFAMTAAAVPEGSVSLKGGLDLAQGSIDLNCRLDQFPSEALDVISRATGKSSVSMATIFGPQIHLTAHSYLTHWNGPVQFQLNSRNIRTSLNGTISDGALRLNESFHMQVSLTPDLSQVLLNAVNPLSLSAITAEAPITMEIPAQGFSYPISPSNPSQIQIPSGRLELGKLFCHNEGNVNIALGLLKLSQFSQNQSLELWFAPLDFHMKDGVMDCERTEILIANTYQVCIWGLLNFVSKKVDMILGLTPSCLKTAFGINNLPEDYVLQIPMKGRMDNVKINTKKATAKIAALLLWQQKAVSNAFGKGSAGAVLGEFMGKLGALPDANSKAPPAKKPFPWDNKTSEKKKISEAPANKKLIVPDEQPFKQILKLLK